MFRDSSGGVRRALAPDGDEVLDNRVSPKDILATTYHLLGIDPQGTVRSTESNSGQWTTAHRIVWLV